MCPGHSGCVGIRSIGVPQPPLCSGNRIVFNRHRRRLGLTVAWLCLLGTASAFAYWTTGGTGSGTATTGTASAVTITQTSAVSGMYPGNGDQDIEFKITN